MLRAIERDKPYLFKREVPPGEIHHHLSSLAYILPTAVKYWYQMLERRSPQDVVAGIKKREKQEGIMEHALEGVGFSLSLVDEHRRANGLRAGVLTHNIDPSLLSVFGLDLTYAMNHSDFTDHAIPHVRRIHRVMDQIILRVPELRHNDSIDRWLGALELFPHNHDMDQVLTLMRNKMKLNELIDAGQRHEFRSHKLTAKAAHGLAAAVMTMALSNRYLQEGGMTELDAAKARHTAFAAALMIAKHEEPDRIDTVFSQHMMIRKKGKPQRIEKFKGTDVRYKGRNGILRLLEDFDHNRIDPFTLSPRQLLEILHQKKSEAGGFVSETNYFGLHPHFAREYKRELDALFRDTDQMLPNLTQTERDSFTLATKVAVFADEVEMIYPPYPSITRSLKTDVSRGRNWWPKDATAEGMLEAISHEGGNYKGPLSSDSYRLFWETGEMIHKAKVSKQRQAQLAESGISQSFDLMSSPYVNKIMKEHVLMRLFAMREFGTRIMKGDLGVIDDMYEGRKQSLARKAIGRSKKTNPIERLRLYSRQNSDEVEQHLRAKGEGELEDSFSFRVRVLNREAIELKDILQHKPDWGVYTDQDIVVFTELCDRLMGQACEVFGISEEEGRQIEEKLHNGADFYKTYDPLGGIPDTIREPLHNDVWTSMLRGQIRGNGFWDLRKEAVAQEEAILH